MSVSKSTPQNEKIHARQIAFAAAFLLPAAKLLEAPSILSKYAGGDLLFPALAHFLIQAFILLGLLYAVSRSQKTLHERLLEAFGRGTIVFYILYAIYFLFAAILPLLDMEKFVYAAFFDTSPTTFAFGAFFLVSAFICAKGIKAIGRAADLCLFLFLLPFLALIFMSFNAVDFSHLLPLFGMRFQDNLSAFTHTTPHFSDAVLLLPLLARYRYQEGDGKKIMAGYGVGSALTLIFLAVFYAVYSSLAPREHYAFSKIAQYFPALNVVGRIDLVFIYLLSIVLIFYTCLPLQYTTGLIAQSFGTERKAWLSAIISALLFIFVLQANKYYDSFYFYISDKLYWIFYLIADMLPLFFIFLPKDRQNKNVKKQGKKEKNYA